MPETYSLGVTAVLTNPVVVAPVITLPDSVARPGAQAAAMRTGTPILCRNLDGSIVPYVIDYERSKPGGTIYLLRTRP